MTESAESKHWMDCEIIAGAPLDGLVNKLRELGFELQIISWVGKTSKITASLLTELDEDDFYIYVTEIVTQFDAAVDDPAYRKHG